MFKSVLVSLAIAVSPTFLSAAVLDFEDLSSGAIRTTLLNGVFTPSDSFANDGFTFFSSHTVYAYGPDNSNDAIPRSGSVFLNTQRAGSNTDPVSLSFEQTDGSLFNVDSLRIAEGRASNFSSFASTALQFTGVRANGETVSYLYQFDGIADSDPSIDFEAVSLHGFENLSFFTMTGVGGANDGYSFSVDDISVSAVPLPAGLIFMLSSVFGLGLLGRRTL